MLSEFALLKLQTISGEEQFIHSVPALVCSKRSKEPRGAPSNNEHLEILPITNIIDTSPYHALIYYHQDNYRIVSVSPIVVNSSELTPSEPLKQTIARNKTLSKAVEEFLMTAKQSEMKDEKSEVVLRSISRITIVSESESEVFYICQPSSSQQRMLPTTQKQANPVVTQTAKVTNVNYASGSKWSSDDHEQLKKLLLQYGYGRWKQIQRSSLTIGGKL